MTFMSLLISPTQQDAKDKRTALVALGYTIVVEPKEVDGLKVTSYLASAAGQDKTYAAVKPGDKVWVVAGVQS